MAIAPDQEGTVDTLQFSFASDIVELVVLTRDDAFLQTLREAVGGPKRVWHVLSAEKVSDLLVAGEVGIVVLDVASMQDAPHEFVTQIKRQFPDLVVVVAGSREAETALAGLISRGVVYRFIHKPMSPGRARLFAEAAVRKYGEQRLRVDLPQRYAPRRDYRRLGVRVAAIVVSVLILGGLVDWRLRATAQHRPVAAAPAFSNGADMRDDLLRRAAAALAADRLAQPTGDNALELYLRATAQNPADPIARSGLAEVRDRLLARAENALLEERAEEAETAIETARRAGIEGGRIALLSARLAKLRIQIRAAQAARQHASVAKAPVAAQVDERVVSLVSLAAERLENGQLVEPDHDSARYYVEAAMSIDPNDLAAQETKRDLAARLLGAARADIDRRDFTHAAQWLQSADGIAAPDNVDTLRAMLADARQESIE